MAGRVNERLRSAVSLVGRIVVLAMLLVGVEVSAQVIDPKGYELFKAHCYEKATAQYLKTFWSSASNKANPKLLKRLVSSILNSEMARDTAAYFSDLYLELEPYDLDGYIEGAYAHFYAKHFDKAIQRLDTFMTYVETAEDIEEAEMLNSWIRNAKRVMRDTLASPIINLGENVNTPFNEMNAYIINDDETLVFSCDDKFDRDATINVWNIKVSDRQGLNWSKSKRISGAINTLNDEHPSGKSDNGMFFCSNRDVGGEFALYEANYAGNGRFTDVYKFQYPINRKGSEVAASLSPSGDTLYFSATTPNDKLDIFYSIRTMTGDWREARPVPGLVNREESDENYPVVTPDGKRMYFASNREGSMGGYDLFYSDFDFKKYEWKKPVQMPYPINDMYDNMTISFTRDGRYAYVSLMRNDGYGGRDIYAIINDRVVPTSAILRCTVKIKGANNKAVNLESQPHIEVTDESGELVALERLNASNSSFILILDPGKYTLTIEADNAKPYSEEIVVEERVYGSKAIDKTIMLTPSAPVKQNK